MAVRKEVEKAVHVREFQRTVNQLLTPEDKDYLFYAMKEYNTYKSVAKLMLALNSCLDTPEKLDLLPYVRDLIPRHDRKRFDNLAPYNRMAHPMKVERQTSESLGKLVNGVSGTSTQETSRIITLQRTPGTSLGFSIRGGREHDLGIFVSHVDSFSLAEQSGLEVGDQIITVNGISFDRLSHHSAVLVLKSHDNLKIEVKHMGCVPGQKLGRNSFIWVDPSGKPVVEEQQQALDRRASSPAEVEREGESRNRLFSSVDKHKVVLHTDKKKSLGFSVRGGSEYGLGIYISMVDKGSPSDEAGLQVGDQIMDVNGHSFASIFHQEAVYLLRSYPTLIMTIKSLGKLPTLASNNNQEGEPERERAKSFTLPRRLGGSFSKLNKSNNSSPATPQTNESSTSEGRQAKVKRSQSDRRPSGNGGTDSTDGGSPSEQRKRSDSNGFNTMPTRRKPMVVSPLATHQSRASVTGSPFTSPSSITPKFFERGVGTQVMLASMSSQAKQLLLDHARRIMNEKVMSILMESLEKYEGDSNVKELVDALVPLLDTPEKIKLLTDIRSVLNPSHVVEFDAMVSPLEVEALHFSDSESGNSEEDLMQDYNTVLSSTEKQRWTRMLPLQTGEKKPSLPDLRTAPALHKATRNSSEPNLPGLPSSKPGASHDSKRSDSPVESGQRGNDQAGLQRALPAVTKPTPVLVEIPKDSPFLGLAIKGGSDTPLKNIYVRELRKGGAVHNEGFIQPGFEVVQVDDKRIRGKTYTEAVESIAESYNGDNTTIKLIVIPWLYPQ